MDRVKAKDVRVPPGNSYHGWCVEIRGQQGLGPFRTQAEAVAARDAWLKEMKEKWKAERTAMKKEEKKKQKVSEFAHLPLRTIKCPHCGATPRGKENWENWLQLVPDPPPSAVNVGRQ